jgi:hypothetical protein
VVLAQNKRGGVAFGAFREGLGGRSFGVPLRGLDSGLSSWILPAGDYWVYVVADGSPVTATLRLPGLTGSSTLRPTRSVDALLVEPPSTLTPSPAGPAFSAGGSHQTKATSFYVSSLTARTTAIAASHSYRCFYEQRPLGPAPWLPRCPASTGGTTFATSFTALYLPPSTSGGTLLGYAWGPSAPPGEYHHGAGIVTAGVLTDAQFLELYLPHLS